MKVLLIEDDSHMRGFLRAHLPPRGFVIDTAEDGEKGLRLFRTSEYELVLLDLNLPDMPGEEVVRKLQEGEHVPPILMLTVTGDAPSKVRLLSAGADDYLAKPFSLDELVARMHALLRRSRDRTPDVLSVEDITLDIRKQTVTRNEKAIPLTLKEFCLFSFLMRHQGMVISKGTLIEQVWDGSIDPFSNSLDTHMTNLRRKLGKPDPITTVHGRGYSING